MINLLLMRGAQVDAKDNDVRALSSLDLLTLAWPSILSYIIHALWLECRWILR